MGGLAVFGPRDVWAAAGTTSKGGGDVVQRWDGQSWRAVDLPHAGRNIRYVERIGGTSGRDVWIITNNSDPYLTLHWDGKRWTCGSVGGAGSQIAALDRDDAWIVNGRTGWRWDGKAWHRVKMPITTDHVAGVPGHGFWAASYTFQGANRYDFLHWDDQQWKQVSIPSIKPPPGGKSGDVEIHDITADPAGGLWAAGVLHWVKPGDVVDEVNPARGVALLLHWDGRSWSQTLGAKGGLYSQVAPDGAGGAWAVETNRATRYVHHAPDGSVTMFDPPLEPGTQGFAGIGHLVNVPGGTVMLAAGRPDKYSTDRRGVIQAYGALP